MRLHIFNICIIIASADIQHGYITNMLFCTYFTKSCSFPNKNIEISLLWKASTDIRTNENDKIIEKALKIWFDP